MGSSPVLTRREVLTTVLLGLVLAVLMTWPLVSRLGTHVPGSLTDPLAEAWELSWSGHQLREDPTALWQGNVFAPMPDSLAFSDSLLGYLPLSLVGPDGLSATLVRYNIAFLLAYAGCFVGATLLARELGASRSAGVVAGVGFAWAPWRAIHDIHLNILTTGGMALAAFLLVRGYRRGSGRLIGAGWAAAAWQLSIGFALGLWFAYALALAGLVVGARWLLAGRPRIGRSMVVGTTAGIGIVAATLALLLPPYLRINERYPQARRPLAEVEFYSPPPMGLLVAPPGNVVWGDATAARRAMLSWPIEQVMFPGVVVVALATTALGKGRLRRRMKAVAVVGLGCLTVMSFGLRGPAGGRWTYRLLYDHAPGWDAMRTPGRLVTFTSLGLAVLAGLGATVILSALGRRLSAARPAWAGTRQHLAARGAAAAGIAAVVLVEGFSTLAVVEVPTPPHGWPGTTRLALHLPYEFDFDQQLMAWSTDYYPRIVNGSTSFRPPELVDLKARMASFPSGDSVAALTALGVKAVVVHPSRLAGTVWADVLTRPVDPLLLEVSSVAELVVYTLRE